jgi:hypothetical protein
MAPDIDAATELIRSDAVVTAVAVGLPEAW